VAALSTSVGRSLLDAMLRADGELLVLRVGEKPFVRRYGADIEIGTRELPAHVVYAIFEGFFPPDARARLTQAGHAHCVLPHHDARVPERFSVSAVQREVLSLEIRRRRSEIVADPPPQTRPAPPVVLLIDDSEDQIDLYEIVLQDHFKVLQAGNGVRGLQLARSARPDAIVCDLDMPGMTGWEVCRHLAADPATASIPVMILTGTSDPYLDAKAAAVGAVGVLTKPCSGEMLRVRIDEVLAEPETDAPPI
jgi:CheY-like chemotaxis protein